MGLPEPTVSRELLPALADAPGHLLWRAAARVTAELAATLPPGVDIHGYAALLALGGGATRSQQAIAAMVDVSRTTMVRVAADLTAQGLVQRVRNPDDRRSYALTRTPDGAATARRWRRHAEDLEDALTAGFTTAEREDLRALLLDIVRSELSPDTPEPLLESLGFLVTRAHQRMHRAYARALEPLRIEPRHFGVLTTLTALGPVPQAELGRQLGVSAASVVQMVDDLETRGLVERRRLETDRRTQVLHLLPEAAEVLAEAGRIADVTMSERMGGLDARRARRLVLLLQRFVTAP